MPRNTPQSPPVSMTRRCNDACSDSYPSSASSRCCGSIAPASAGEMPNARLSKRSAELTKPPCRTHSSCVAVSKPVSTASASVHRVVGTAPSASPDASCSSTFDRSSLHPPGQRPTVPTTASGELASTVAAAVGATTVALVTPPTCSSRCEATARGVGCSNTIVGESGTPVSERSRDESSVAASESTPASIRGVSALTADAGAPVSSRTTPSTAASAWARCCCSGSRASARASSLSLVQV